MSSDTTKSVSKAADPGDSQTGSPTVPMWLIVLTGLLLYGGAVYFDLHGGWFSPQVYPPFRNLAEVEIMHPVTQVDPIALGKMVYNKPTCVNCHQGNGLGMPGQYPPLAGSDWVNEKEPGRVIRIVLNGLQGQITVLGKEFNGSMTAWGADPPIGLTDEEIAAVLTYVRQNKEWRNDAPAVTPERVKAVREVLEAQGKKNPFTPDELLKISPSE
jgi:mono/diheme cytochrome c family protein